MLKRHALVVGPFQCNCSIVVCEKTKEAIVVDPGDELERIVAACEKSGVNLKYAVHTHGHLDHIGAVKGLKAKIPTLKIALHQGDEDLYGNLPMQGRLFGFEYETPPPIDHYLNDGEELSFGEQRFKVIHTPGHSPGGVCFRFEAGALSQVPVVFSGDTLFQRSVGRTDLWGGDHRQLIKSIKDRLLSLDGQTEVLPGHGAGTTIEAEAKENPFL